MNNINGISGLKEKFTIFDEIDYIIEKVIDQLEQRGYDSIKHIFKIPNKIPRNKKDPHLVIQLTATEISVNYWRIQRKEAWFPLVVWRALESGIEKSRCEAIDGKNLPYTSQLPPSVWP